MTCNPKPDPALELGSDPDYGGQGHSCAILSADGVVALCRRGRGTLGETDTGTNLDFTNMQKMEAYLDTSEMVANALISCKMCGRWKFPKV